MYSSMAFALAEPDTFIIILGFLTLWFYLVLSI
jgi:hypothetical protein